MGQVGFVICMCKRVVIDDDNESWRGLPDIQQWFYRSDDVTMGFWLVSLSNACFIFFPAFIQVH